MRLSGIYCSVAAIQIMPSSDGISDSTTELHVRNRRATCRSPQSSVMCVYEMMQMNNDDSQGAQWNWESRTRCMYRSADQNTHHSITQAILQQSRHMWTAADQLAGDARQCVCSMQLYGKYVRRFMMTGVCCWLLVAPNSNSNNSNSSNSNSDNSNNNSNNNNNNNAFQLMMS